MITYKASEEASEEASDEAWFSVRLSVIFLANCASRCSQVSS